MSGLFNQTPALSNFTVDPNAFAAAPSVSNAAPIATASGAGIASGVSGWVPAVTQAAGSILKGTSEYNAGKTNAAASTAEARQAIAAATENAARQRRMVALQQSKLVATAGGQGTTMEGSPMEVYLANAKQGELEAQDQAYAGLLRAHAKRLEALNAKQRGNAGLTTGLIGAVSPILSKLA